MGRVVLSDDPQKFLSQLSTMSAYNDMQDQLFDDYATELKSLDIRSDATTKRAAQVADLEQELASEKSEIDKKLAEAKTLLGHLQAEQREQIVSRDSVRTPTNVPASGRAAAAVAYAMAQVGKAYVYGAAGPSAFDCSGLTMMAWAQAGVSLPHSSSAQYSSGPHIAESDLQPGDLVFYYSPISHVGMYIGNGMIVNAENPSAGVRVTSLHSMPYVGAVRPG
jgi:cell wall-associated NlpC family hydrolase